jgi:hypothetical protein
MFILGAPFFRRSCEIDFDLETRAKRSDMETAEKESWGRIYEQ